LAVRTHAEINHTEDFGLSIIKDLVCEGGEGADKEQRWEEKTFSCEKRKASHTLLAYRENSAWLIGRRLCLDYRTAVIIPHLEGPKRATHVGFLPPKEDIA
jgi:hypothetical protein